MLGSVPSLIVEIVASPIEAQRAPFGAPAWHRSPGIPLGASQDSQDFLWNREQGEKDSIGSCEPAQHRRVYLC
jgi:hypothetical protein